MEIVPQRHEGQAPGLHVLFGVVMVTGESESRVRCAIHEGGVNDALYSGIDEGVDATLCWPARSAASKPETKNTVSMASRAATSAS